MLIIRIMGLKERKQRDKEEMKRLILKCARELFLDEGFDKVTIRRIADKMEYSPTTIYLYFSDKDEILFALHKEGFELLYKQQLSLFKLTDPLEKLRNHAMVYVNFARQNPEFYTLMFLQEGPARVIEKLESWTEAEPCYDFLRQTVKQVLSQLSDESDPEVLTLIHWSFLHGLASLMAEKRLFNIPGESREILVQSAIDSFIDRIQATKG
jgi:AcrR family transcriptional regulator